MSVLLAESAFGFSGIDEHVHNIDWATMKFKRRRVRRPLPRRRSEVELLETRLQLTGFTAYNGLFSGDTHENTTFYSDIPGRDSSGQLKDIETGDDTPILLNVNHRGVHFGGNGAVPARGTDAHDIFDNFVDLSAGAERSIEIESGELYQYTFENLDSGATYEFASTAIRGNDNYTNRWTLVEIVGADSFTAAHSGGNGVVSNGLQENQIAIWFGDNTGADQGYVAQWTDIDPGADGIFQVVSTQYEGTVPRSIHSSGRADGSKGYGIAAIRLIENIPAGPPAVETVAATYIQAFEATVAGNITTTGGQIPDVRIYYGTNDGVTNPAAWQHSVDLGKNSRAFSTVIDQLSQNTTYFYRAFAQNGLGSAWSASTRSFTTLPARVPQIQNSQPVDVGAFAAVLEGRVVDTGNDNPIVVVYYGDNDGGTSAGSWDHSVELDVQTGDFAATVTGLEPLTQYYFTSYAQNVLGSDWATPSRTFTTTDTPPLQISEMMADNSTTLNTRVRANRDDSFRGDQLTPDWIEIENPTNQVADVGGFYLSNRLNDPRRWQIPAGTVIPAGGHLIVFASGLDIRDIRLDEEGSLHANFLLDSSGGDDITLSDGSGEIVFVLENTPLQSEDISYGIDTSGSTRFFNVPTPGESNANDVPKAPRITVGSTTFTDSIVVEIEAASPSHTIRYTTNERVPTTNSTVYDGPLIISSTTQLRAISVAPNDKASTVVSESYIELAANVLDDDSNLPYLIVDTFGDSIGSSFADAFMAIIEPDENGETKLTHEFDLQTRGGLHVRGSSSAGFSKKQYRVEFWDEQNEDQKHEVLGLPKEADWIFYGPGQYDRNLMSNPLMYDLSNQIGRYATRTQYVEMYLNQNGGQLNSSDYVGVYAIMEVIEEGKDRIDVGDLSTGAGGIPVSGGFIWKNDRGSAYVDPEDTTSAQRRYIDGWINDLRAAAGGRNFKDPELGYAKYADVDSFIDHNILNLLAMNVDALRLSSYYYKKPDGKLEAGPIWDFDRSLDSTDGRDNNPRTWFGTGDSTRYFDDSSRVMSWWPDMFQDPDFVQAYIDRWFELRDNEFSLENINQTIDAHADQINEAAARDYRRWSGSRFRNFQGEVDHLKTWLKRRVEWIDGRWLDRPDFNVDDAQVARGTQVSISSGDGDVYYTLDGTDPRGEDGAIRPEAIRATGPVTINGFTKITARVYDQGHGSDNGYVRSGDDWSAPAQRIYFNDPPADASNFSVSEVNYHPHEPSDAEMAAGFDDADDFEFMEFVNTSNQDVVLTSMQLVNMEIDGREEGVEFDFTNSAVTTLAPGERVLVVENLEAFELRYGSGLPVAGQWSGGLSNNTETISLMTHDGTVFHQFKYNDSGSWPGRPDGNGSSLEVASFDGDLSEVSSWRASVDFGGSPGAAGSTAPGIVVNEILAHTDPPLTPSDSIELLNTTSQAINIGGWYISDSSADFLKYRIPNGTTLGAGQYIVLDESDFNPNPLNPGQRDFALSGARGDDVWLTIPDENGGIAQFVDEVHFPATLNGESMGRIPNGMGELVPLVNRSLGQPNSNPRIGPVIISELNYNPGRPSLNALVLDPDLTADDLEFVEIFNSSPLPIDLTEWRIRGGVDYEFPIDEQLQVGEAVLVLSFNPAKPENTNRLAAFRAHFQIGNEVKLVGGYSGQLSDSGESVRLQRPDDPPVEDPTLIPRILEDQISYDELPPWPNANGTQDSLTRTSTTSLGLLPDSWAATAPTPGTTEFEVELKLDLNDDGLVDFHDANFLCNGIRTGAPQYDVNSDGSVNHADVSHYISLLGTGPGDSNIDGVFNSTDLILVFQAGQYEDAIAGNSVWSTGDWNCDGDFDSSDLVEAFGAGNYAANSRVARLADRAGAAILHESIEPLENDSDADERVTVRTDRSSERQLDVQTVESLFAEGGDQEAEDDSDRFLDLE